MDKSFPEWVEPAPGPRPSLDSESGEVPRLSSRDAVRLGLAHSRSLQALYDMLKGQALSLREARRDFTWDASVGAEWLRAPDGESDGTSIFSVEDTLATGASVQLRGSFDLEDALLDSKQGTARLRVEQPLLQGMGYDLSHESLIQAERTLRYQIRAFETEREDTLLSILASYYDLINQFSVLENVRRNLTQSTFLRERSEAVRGEKASYLDVLRAQQQELTASNQYENALADVTTAKKTFMVELGLDSATRFDVETGPPPVLVLTMDEVDLIDVGLTWRRDLQTSRARVEDAERRLRIARNGRLPDVNIFAQTEGFIEETEQNENGVSSGISLSVPLQRGDLRDAIQQAEINLHSARRNQIEAEADAEIDLLQRRNQLNNFRRNLIAARRNVDIAGSQLEFATIRFEDGSLPNRDVVEAQDNLLTAQNALVRALVNHELERLRLLQSAGCLIMTPDGHLKAREIPGMVWFTQEPSPESES